MLVFFLGGGFRDSGASGAVPGRVLRAFGRVPKRTLSEKADFWVPGGARDLLEISPRFRWKEKLKIF